MEFADALRVDEAPTHPERSGRRDRGDLPLRCRYELVVLLVAAAVFQGTCFGPPSLMDDVDAVQAQIARKLDSGDWAARLPIALAAVALCWLTSRIGWWAFSAKAGLYAGLGLATSVGLFLFTRILIPDVILTLSITLAMWSMLRAPEEDEPRAWRWAWTMAASIGIGLLLKGLIAAVFPVAAGLIYLLLTRQLFARRTWERLRPFSGTLLILLIAAPWHVLATIRNPRYFYFSMRSVPGEYHGFFWFYFSNEHLRRFLNRRYPQDYNTVPRVYSLSPVVAFSVERLFTRGCAIGPPAERPQDKSGIWIERAGRSERIPSRCRFRGSVASEGPVLPAGGRAAARLHSEAGSARRSAYRFRKRRQVPADQSCVF